MISTQLRNLLELSKSPDAIEKLNLSDLRKQHIAIDGCNFLMRLLARSSEDSFLDTFYLQILKLIRGGLSPTFVFGSLEGHLFLSDQLPRCTEFLRDVGIPFIQGSFDSLAKCLSLFERGIFDAIATDDPDALLYGGKIVLTNLASKYRKISRFNILRFLQAFNLSFDQFLDAAIMLGCTKCPRMKKMGAGTALDWVQRHKNIETIMQQTGFTPSSSFNYQWARTQYKAQGKLIPIEDYFKGGCPNKDQLVRMNLCHLFPNNLRRSFYNPNLEFLDEGQSGDNNVSNGASAEQLPTAMANPAPVTNEGKIEMLDNTFIWTIDQNKVHVARFANSFMFETDQIFFLTSIGLNEPDSDIEVSSQYDFTNGVQMSNGRIIVYSLKCLKTLVGSHTTIVKFQFKGETSDEFRSTIINIMVTNEDIKSLEPKTPYTKQNGRRFRKPCRNQIPGMRWENKKFSFEEKHKLGPYPMNKNVKNLLDAGFPKRAVAGDLAEESTRCQSLLSNVCWDDYKDHWNLLVTCEEYQMNIDIRSFDMERAPLTTNANPKLLSLIVPGLSENRPSLMRGDIIFASFYPNDTSSAPEDREYEGFVHEIQEKQIHVGFNKSLLDRFINEMKFHIRFTFNRHPLRTMFRAIENVPKTGVTWKNLLFPEAQNFPDSSNLPTLTPYNSIINENDKQKIAVANILEGGIPGIPYIIFGPPGTGKTVTMVEAIKQVWKKKEGSRILVSAPSNEAADLLAIRLLDNIPKSEMIRFYAISRDEQSISKKPDNFKAITTFSKFPSSFQDLLDYRIIVVTVVTASKMVSAGFPKNHFSHFFIDEAGQATEPETLIPISGLLDPEKGQLILAGDPKQLGPIIRSPIALQYGLEVSLLERLMSRDCYKPTNSNLYNSRCITKLCENYRSHPKLLELPSKLFYDSQLVAKGNEALINAMVNWENLPNPNIGFPMIFHGVIGVDKREEKSPSFFNLEEASIVVDYVQKLLEGRQRGMQKIEPKDIGIISPYRKQVIKIKEMMKKKFPRTFPNWNEMTVGSTEMFQGQERKIIIISTVRSQVELLRDDFTFKLGFLQNPKRFNVAITRMKALLIIVGNPILLSVDPHWKELVKFAKENGGYKGQHFDDGGLREMLQKFNALNLDRNTITSLSLAPEILQDLSQNEASEEAPWDNDKI